MKREVKRFNVLTVGFKNEANLLQENAKEGKRIFLNFGTTGELKMEDHNKTDKSVEEALYSHRDKYSQLHDKIYQLIPETDYYELSDMKPDNHDPFSLSSFTNLSSRSNINFLVGYILEKHGGSTTRLSRLVFETQGSETSLFKNSSTLP